MTMPRMLPDALVPMPMLSVWDTASVMPMEVDTVVFEAFLSRTTHRMRRAECLIIFRRCLERAARRALSAQALQHLCLSRWDR